MCSRLHVLKALQRSVWRHQSSGSESRAARTPCTMASAPPRTDTPNWVGLNMAAALGASFLITDLAVILLSTEPQASGRIPPFLFGIPWSLALAKKGLTRWGT